MNYLSVYAVTQIVGESLPLSSSGNVKVWTTLCNTLGLLSPCSMHVSKEIDFLLHLPTLIILLIFFFKRWIAYLPWYGCRWQQTVRVLLWVGLVDIITSIFYMWRALHEYCSSTKILPLWIGFLITAVFLYSIKNQNKKTDTPTEDSVFTFKKAVAFGLMQSIAVLPGISRFASTYALGCWYGYKPSDALWFSFLIQLPLLIAANGLLILTAPLESLALSELSTWVLLASCVSAYGVLTLVAHKAYRCTFWHFSWYALGLAALAFYLGL